MKQDTHCAAYFQGLAVRKQSYAVTTSGVSFGQGSWCTYCGRIEVIAVAGKGSKRKKRAQRAREEQAERRRKSRPEKGKRRH